MNFQNLSLLLYQLQLLAVSMQQTFLFQAVTKFLFRVGISHEDIVWKAMQVIQATMKQLASLAWPGKGIDRFPVSSSIKGRYDNILYQKTDNSINVDFNLTEPVEVLTGGIITLLNATMRLNSPRVEGEYKKWRLVGWGKEVMLG